MTHQWPDFARSDSIDFRAACNDGAAPGDRPLAPSIVRSIAGGPEARRLFEGLFDGGEELSVQAILKTLNDDSRWRTIVAEHVAAAKKEAAQLHSLAELWPRFWAWFNKRPAPGVPSPRDRSATSAMAMLTGTLGVTGGLVLAIKVLPPEALVIPVSLQMPPEDRRVLSLDIRPNVPDGTLPFKFTLEPSIKDGKIPIEISARAEAIPLQFSKTDLQALDRIGVAVSRAARAIQIANEQVAPQFRAELAKQAEAVRQAIANIQTQEQRSGDYVKPLAEALTKIADTLASQPPAAGIKELSGQLEQAGRALNRIGGLTAAGRTLTTMAAPENHVTTASVDWPTAHGTVTACEVKVKAGKIARTVEIGELRIKCGEEAERAVGLRATAVQVLVGDVLRADGLPFGIAVDAIQRPLFGPNVAILRIIATPMADTPTTDTRQTRK